MSAATTAEDGLVREKAAGMTLLQLQEEVKRCKYGIEVAASAPAKARFQRRLEIMAAALTVLERKAGVL